MAVLTTMAMPPMLRAALAGLPMSKEEETRINREGIDQRGFLPGLERLLLAVDDSAVGRMGARLAGLLAGAQGMPITILKLQADLRRADRPAEEKKQDPEAREDRKRKEDRKEMSGAESRKEAGADLKTDPLAREIKAGARKSASRVIADEAEPDPEKVHITARVPVDAPAEVVKEEARKGYDLMFIGLEASVEKDGGFAPKVTQLAAGFDGPLVVFSHARDDPGPAPGPRTRMLVPVNGSPQSRKAAEVAFALARASGARVHVLFVSRTDGHSRTRLREERVLKDMAELGERYDVTVTTRISARAEAAAAILKEARRNFSMIVMGVSARPGEELFFGETATAILRQWDGATLMVAT
jgi:nucleotide-binding universal stress UspA family protein